MFMEKKLFIPLILGTNRKDRESEKAAKYVLVRLDEHPEIETRLFDAREFKFPQDDYGEDLKEAFPEYRDAVIRADGLVIVSPEYNHGYPGVLKMILDTLLREYVHKPVGLVGVSAGSHGGARVIEQLVGVSRELGLIATFTDLRFGPVGNLFDENGEIKEEFKEKYVKMSANFLEELVWMAKVMRWGRENLPSQYH